MSGFTSLGKKNSGGGSGGDGILNANAIGPFGTSLVSNLTPSAQGAFVYGINDILWKKVLNGGADIQSSNGVASCVTSASTASRALLEFKRGCKYRPGQGVISRFTSVYSPGQSGTLQLSGVGNDESGYYFAMSGSTFGILHRERSQCEIRSFTVSAVPGTATLTVTLGGFSKSISISGDNNANQTAYQLSLGDFSNVGSGFHAEAHGSTIYFISCIPGILPTGTWDIKSGETSIATNPLIIQSGSNPTDYWIPQSQWNIDTLDGSGPSRFDLDPLKGNVYGIGYQYLGFGNPVFSVENPETGLLTQCHMIHRAGSSTSTVLKNPSTTIRWEAQNSSPSTPAITLSGASAGIFNEGLVARNIGVSFSSATFKTGLTSTEVPVMSIRANKTFKSQSCFGELSPFNISIGSDTGNSSSGKLMRVQIWKNLGLTGPTDFVHIDSDKSIASYDISSTGFTSNSSRAQLLKSMFVAANNSVILKLEDENFFISNGDILTITAKSMSNSNIDIAAVSVSWFEDQ